MRVDRAVVNGLVVLPSGLAYVHLGIRDGIIRAIVDDPWGLEADDAIDARGLVVLPGVIEPHCHFWDPGPTYREDWETGTRSAAAGGVTTTIEMPLSVPPTVDAAAFRLKQERANACAITDYALWGGIVPDSINGLTERLLEMRELGAVAYKAFMCWSANEFPPIDDGILLAAMEELARHDLLLGLHCENDAIIKRREVALLAAGRHDPQAHLESRPEIAEYEAIQRAIALAEETGARLYIVHMSLPQGAELIRQARARGVRVWAETAPRYLMLDDTGMDRQGPFVKCSPPLRSGNSQYRLWREVLGGTIDTLGSDHSTFTYEEKAAGEVDIWKAPNGIPDIQTALPLLLSEGVHRRGMSLERLASLVSTNVARIFGLYPQKGVVAVGSDADLTLVDLDAEWRITNDAMHYRH
ncbi:MAG TPA: allantoinase AllB, partial [Chloroflexota bacterium]